MRFDADQQWLLQSPELLQLTSDISVQAIVAQLKAEQNFSFQKTHRLGVYFEQLWFHLLNSSQNIQSLKQNLQIIIDKQTLGEFDSIFNWQDRTVHCELVVKFYLKIGKGDALSDWVGPNLKDRFDNKYKRLFEHQLQLSELPQVKSWLAANAISIDEKRLLTRGRLFYPFADFMAQNFRYPSQVSDQHLKGFWIEYQALAAMLQSTDWDWYQVPRFYWLAEVTADDIEQLLPIDHNFAGFSLQKIVAMDRGKEMMRGFVVNHDWLHKAQQRIKG